MKTLAKLSFVTVALGFAACAAGPQTSIVSPVASSPTLAPDEEGADEWESDCRQELGLDSGEAQRAHRIDANEWINGCFVNGDDVDAFVLDVSREATYQIELIHRGGGALEATVLASDGSDLVRDALEEGAHVSRSVRLVPGASYVLRVAKAPGSSSAWYRLKAAPLTQMANK